MVPVAVKQVVKTRSDIHEKLELSRYRKTQLSQISIT